MTRIDRLTEEIAGLTTRVEATTATTAADLTGATQAAARAESLLTLLAVRRALENGQRLGALEPVLRRHFGASFAAPVEAIATLGAQPVTLPALQAGLDRLRPQFGSVDGRSWWDSVTASLGTIVHVRDAGTPVGSGGPPPFERAAAALRSGDVAAAREQVAALPPGARAATGGWLGAADRYLAGMRALGALETAALVTAPATNAGTL